MSDFESEHDSDSSDDGAPNENNRPVHSAGGGANLKEGLETGGTNSEKGQAGNDAEDQRQLKPNAKDAEDVADMTADFLAELKKAGEKTGRTTNQQEVEPWQLYLQQGAATDSYKYQDPSDGTIYEWDPEKRAWFPKVKKVSVFH